VFLLALLTFPLHDNFRLPYTIFNKSAMSIRIFTEFIWLSIQNGEAGGGEAGRRVRLVP
jgi:hypothetical protein